MPNIQQDFTYTQTEVNEWFVSLNVARFVL